MKRFLSVVLMILLLVQALPAEALAATGGTLSAQALASARDLAGVNEDAGVYHTGMPLSAAMNAGQLVGWLEDVMENELHSVGHMTGRVAVALEDMRRNDTRPGDGRICDRCAAGVCPWDRGDGSHTKAQKSAINDRRDLPDAWMVSD